MRILILAFFVVTFICSEKTSETKEYSYPPEWYPHQAVWIDFHDDSHIPVPDTRARFEIIEKLHDKRE